MSMGKRKYMVSAPNYADKSNSSGMYWRKNPRFRPCREIVYTEDSVPVRKLFFSISSADVSISNNAHRVSNVPFQFHFFRFFFFLYILRWNFPLTKAGFVLYTTYENQSIFVFGKLCQFSVSQSQNAIYSA